MGYNEEIDENNEARSESQENDSSNSANNNNTNNNNNNLSLQKTKDGNIKKPFPIVANGAIFQSNNRSFNPNVGTSLINYNNFSLSNTSNIPGGEINNNIQNSTHPHQVYYSIQNNIHPNNHYNNYVHPRLNLDNSGKMQPPFIVTSSSSSNVYYILIYYILFIIFLEKQCKCRY